MIQNMCIIWFTLLSITKENCKKHGYLRKIDFCFSLKYGKEYYYKDMKIPKLHLKYIIYINDKYI